MGRNTPRLQALYGTRRESNVAHFFNIVSIGDYMQNLIVRTALLGDVPRMTEIYTPYVEADTASFETVAPDTGEMARRLQKTTEVFPWLVCEQAGQVIGYAYASRLGERAGYDWSAAASVYVAGSSRRTGAGKALYNASSCCRG